MDSRVALLAIKGVILVVLAVQFGVVDMPIWLGERLALSAKPESTGDKPGEIEVPELDGDDQGPASPASGKRSLIDDLLYLPKIDRDSLTKNQLAKYLDMLDRKKLLVETKIQSLKTEHARLKAMEGQVEVKIDKLQEELKFFQQTVQKEKEFSEERLSKLISFYKKVPPKKSAPVFESLDKDLVVSLFNGLPQKQVTKILALMNPQKSVEITEYYGRVKSAKEYMLLKEINKELAESFKKCSEVTKPAAL